MKRKIFKSTLQIKISALMIVILFIGFGVFVFYVIRHGEASLLNEREKASTMMAQPIVHAIYKDMLDERAEMVYYLIGGV